LRPLTSEEILAKCPAIIRKSDIVLRKLGGKPRTGGGSRKSTWWRPEDRIRAASVYAVVANVSRVEEITGVPQETIRRWRTEDWWQQVIDRVRQEKDDEADKNLTEIIDTSLEVVKDRLVNGDTVVTKSGDLVTKPIGGKEAGVILSIAVDKRDMLRRKQKSQVEQQSTQQLLQNIANTVRDFIAKTDQKTIEGEVIAKETNTVAASDETKPG
jgi:hypothetical protein